jgi:hypothetical protein
MDLIVSALRGAGAGSETTHASRVPSELDVCFEPEHRSIVDVRLCVRPECVLKFGLQVQADRNMDIVVDLQHHLLRLPGRGGVAERDPERRRSSIWSNRTQLCVFPVCVESGEPDFLPNVPVSAVKRSL